MHITIGTSYGHLGVPAVPYRHFGHLRAFAVPYHGVTVNKTAGRIIPPKIPHNDRYWSRQKFWNEGVRLVTKWTDFRQISEETRYENGQIFKIGLQWIERMQVLKKPRQGRPAITSDLGPENILKLEVLISTILEEFQGPNRLEGGRACEAGAPTL